MKICDNIFFLQSKKTRKVEGINVVNEGEKERFRKRNVERTKEKRKAGRGKKGRKERGRKKTGGRGNIKLCYSVSLITQKGKKYLL